MEDRRRWLYALLMATGALLSLWEAVFVQPDSTGRLLAGFAGLVAAWAAGFASSARRLEPPGRRAEEG